MWTTRRHFWSQWGRSPLFHLQTVNEAGCMTLDGNAISCDAYGCGTQDTFDGALSAEDIRLRYHILGWQIGEKDGREAHFCSDHS